MYILWNDSEQALKSSWNLVTLLNISAKYLESKSESKKGDFSRAVPD